MPFATNGEQSPDTESSKHFDTPKAEYEGCQSEQGVERRCIHTMVIEVVELVPLTMGNPIRLARKVS